MCKSMDYFTEGLINKAVEVAEEYGLEIAQPRVERLIYTIDKTEEVFGKTYDGGKWRRVLEYELENIV